MAVTGSGTRSRLSGGFGPGRGQEAVCRGGSDHQEKPDQAASRSENPRPSGPLELLFS